MECIEKELENVPGIYKINNNVNGKCYIGQSMKLRTRYQSHKNMLVGNSHNNKHLQRAYNINELTFEILEYCTVVELDKREIYWIAHFDSTNRKNGYNFESGGNCNRIKHPETIAKLSDSLKRYFSDKNKRMEHSIKRSVVPLEFVIKIKSELFNNLNKNCNQIADDLKVKVDLVAHIQQLESHGYILENLNYVIKNRVSISEKRKTKRIMDLYRCGLSFRDIASFVDIHQRNVIRKINKNKNIHDDRCRLNSINKSIDKRNSLIRTLYSMGKNTVEISKILNVSRATIRDVLNNNIKKFTDVSQTRGIFKYEKSNRKRVMQK